MSCQRQLEFSGSQIPNFDNSVGCASAEPFIARFDSDASDPSGVSGDDSVELLRDEDDGEEDHPLPEAGRVQDQQPPVQPVVQVREVEHLPCVNQSDVSICRASANQK